MPKLKSNPHLTSLTITAGFLVVYFTLQVDWALWVAFAVSVLTIVSTQIGLIIEKIWFKLSEILGFIMPKILLSVIFYLILFPIAVLSRIFGNKDPLKLSNPENSNFYTIEKTFSKKDFEQPW